jgi:hypothetical protein
LDLTRVKRSLLFLLLIVGFIATLVTVWYFEIQSQGSSFVVVKPVAYQTFQRDWEQNIGSIELIVDAATAEETFVVETKWVQGVWIPVNLVQSSLPCDAASLEKLHLQNEALCQRYEGRLLGLPPGQAHLYIRKDKGWLDIGNNPVAIHYVSIGDVFLTSGQSNSRGMAKSEQFYVSDCYVASVFSPVDNQWRELHDDYTRRNPDNYKNGFGSHWLPLATKIMAYTHVPVAFIPTGRGGQVIAAWREKREEYKYILQQVSASGVQPGIILWHQGESDALERTTRETYANELNSLAQNLYNNYKIPMIAANLGEVQERDVPPEAVQAIRNAIEQAWDKNPLIWEGPRLEDVDLEDDLHFRTDEEVEILAQRWFESLIKSGLPKNNPHC